MDEKKKVVGRPFTSNDPRGNKLGRPPNVPFLLEKYLGPNCERGIELAWKIATGQVAYEELVRKPNYKDDAATVSLIPRRLAVPAWPLRWEVLKYLIERQIGKVPETLQVTSHNTNVNADGLTITPELAEAMTPVQLAALRATLEDAKRRTQAPSDAIVDAEVVPE